MPAFAWMRRHKIISAVAAILVIGLIGSALGGEDEVASEPTVVVGETAPSATSSPEPTEEATTVAPTPTPEAAPAPPAPPTEKEVWLSNYVAQEPSYLAAVAAALALSSAPTAADVSAVKTCAEVGKGLTLPKRVARLSRRIATSATFDQSIAALDATVTMICPEMTPAHTEQLILRAANLEKARQAAREAARQAAAEERREQEAAAAAAAQAAEAEEEQAFAYYENCSDVEAAGAAPIYTGDPGYSRDLDRDGDGVACE